jgi:hypothetical protein
MWSFSVRVAYVSLERVGSTGRPHREGGGYSYIASKGDILMAVW